MKQGMGKSTIAGGKVEPSSKAVSPEAAAEIGRQVTHVRSQPALYQGRGYEAPKAASTSHRAGSQGKH